jgi:hypothetical protein
MRGSRIGRRLVGDLVDAILNAPVVGAPGAVGPAGVPVRPATARKAVPAAARVVDRATGASELAGGAYWSVTHPVDRMMGRGRASEQVMMIPTFRRLRATVGYRPGQGFYREKMTRSEFRDYDDTLKILREPGAMEKLSADPAYLEKELAARRAAGKIRSRR